MQGEAFPTAAQVQYDGTASGLVAVDVQAALDEVVAESVSEALLTAKGDLISATAPGVPTVVPVGANGKVLAANSAQPSGLEWVTPAAGSSVPTGTGFRHVTVGVEDPASKLVDTADINADQVTNAKLANVATATIKGRATAGAGDPEDLTAAQAKGVLDIQASEVDYANGASGLSAVTVQAAIDEVVAEFIAAAVFNAKGDLISATAADTPTILPVGTNGQVLASDSTALSGLRWVTPAAGATVPTGTGFRHVVAGVEDAAAKLVDTADVNADQITFAKLQNIATDRLIGRDTVGSGDPEEVAVGGGLEFTGGPGIQRSALTGDVTAVAGSGATTIAVNAVTNAKLAQMAQATVKGRAAAAGTGDPVDLTPAQLKTIIGALLTADISDDQITFAKLQNIATDRLIGRDTALTGDPEEISVGGGLEFTGGPGIQRSALTGDVTSPAGSNATTIPANTVDNARLTDMVQATVKGRATGAGTGDPTDLTTAQLTALLDLFTTSLKGAVPASGGGTVNFLRADGTWNAPPGSATPTGTGFRHVVAGVEDAAAKLVDTADVNADQITFAKMQNLTTDRLVGRDTALAGDPEEISVGGGLEFTGTAGIQRSALTGDVTAPAGSNATTIPSNTVDNPRLADMAQSTVKGRAVAAGTGDPTDLTSAQITAILALFTTSLQGAVPASGGGTVNFLRADGSWSAPPGGATPTGTGFRHVVAGVEDAAAKLVDTADVNADQITFAKMQNLTTDRLVGRDTAASGDPEEISVGGGIEFTGTLGIQRSALTGDVTAPAGSNATTIAANAVSNAKLAQMVQATVKGRAAAAGTGDPVDLTSAQLKTIIGALLTADIADNQVTFAKLQDITTDRLIGRDTALSGDPEEISVGGGLEFTGTGGIQRSALTGDVTATAGSSATLIANNAVTTVKIANTQVTNAKLNDMIQSTIKGRAVGTGTGVPVDLTATQATAILNQFTLTLQGLVPPPGGGGTVNFLRADGTWTAPPGLSPTGTGFRHMVAGTEDAAAKLVDTADVNADQITFAKMQNLNTDRLMGRDTAAAGDPEEISVGGGLEFTGTAAIQRSALTGDVTAPAGSGVTTIPAASISNNQLALITGPTIRGRASGTGAVQNLTSAQATSILDLFTSLLQGAVPASGGGTLNFLRADGTWVAPPGGGSVPTGTGFRHVVAGVEDAAAKLVDTADINDAQVTLAKLVNSSAASTVIGRDSATPGVFQEINITGGLEMNGTGGLRRSALTGDVLATAGSGGCTIAPLAVTGGKIADDTIQNSKLATMTAGLIKGRALASGLGNPVNLTSAQTTEILDLFTSTLKGVVPASGGGTTTFLRADGTWTTVAGSAPTGTGFRHITAGTEDGAAKLVDTADINADQVTYAKIQNVSATDKILGRATAGAGDVEEIACTAAARTVLDDTTVAAMVDTLGGAVATGTGGLVRAASSTVASLVFAAGSATANSWPKMLSGTVLTTAEAGALEYDGNVFYASPVAAKRALMRTCYFRRLTSDFALANSGAAQILFPAGSNTITLSVGAYEFELLVFIDGMSGTTGNANFSVLGTGTAVISNGIAGAIGADDAPNVTGVGGGGSWATSLTFTGINAIFTNTQTGMWVVLKGTFDVGTAGTLIPSVTLTTAIGTAVVRRGSIMKVWPIGATSVASVGPWS